MGKHKSPEQSLESACDVKQLVGLHKLGGSPHSLHFVVVLTYVGAERDETLHGCCLPSITSACEEEGHLNPV